MTQLSKLKEDKMPSAMDRQVGGSHYKGLTPEPFEFFHTNNIPFHKADIMKRILRYDKPTGKGHEDLRKIIHECQMIIELECEMIVELGVPKEEKELAPCRYDGTCQREACPMLGDSQAMYPAQCVHREEEDVMEEGHDDCSCPRSLCPVIGDPEAMYPAQCTASERCKTKATESVFIPEECKYYASKREKVGVTVPGYCSHPDNAMIVGGSNCQHSRCPIIGEPSAEHS